MNANTYIVNTAGDPGPVDTLSLRQAIISANGGAGNVIEFDPTIDGSTITLLQGQIEIDQPMQISATEQNITISGNDTSRIFFINETGSVSLDSFTLTKGKAGAGGAAVRTSGSEVSLSNIVVVANSGGAYSAASAGAGIQANHTVLTIKDSIISGNTSNGPGGGISIYGGSTTVVRTVISGNASANYGGGMLVRGGLDQTGLMLDESSIVNNKTTQIGSDEFGIGGGGIALLNSSAASSTSVTFTNSTIANNYAPYGGSGLRVESAVGVATTQLTFCTISGNSSGVSGVTGAGMTNIGVNSMITLFGTLVANNFDSAKFPVDMSGTFVANYSVIKTPGAAILSGTGSVLGVDPQLGALGNHGGSTWTMVPASTSPAIDLVTTAYSETVDQRGAARPVGAAADGGAVERQVVEDILFRDGFDF